MITKTRKVGALLLSLAVFGSVALADGKRVAFIGCPVIRDMELPERPCWLAQEGNKLYFLGMQGDTFPPALFYPPQLKHQVLVEGEEGEGEKICGGLPLNNVKVSVLRELDLSCDTVLPKEGFPAGPILRPTAPYRPGRGVATDRSYPREVYKRPPPPQPPFEARSYRIDFGFDDDFLHLAEGIEISTVFHYFEDIKASKLTVEVHRDRVELTNGTILEEDPAVAQRRANRMLNLFTAWGVPASKIETRLISPPAPSSRYLTLTVQP